VGLTSDARATLIGRLLGALNLRFPGLFALFAGLTLLDLLVPDVIPFADEIGLALLTLLLGLWKARRPAPPPPPDLRPRSGGR
jgi:hypothetical protein